MGQKDKKREHLIQIIQSYLETAKALMLYYKYSATDRKGKFACNKSIKSIEQAIVHIRQIKHIEILDYLYGSFIGNNPIAYSISGALVNSKKLAYYDTDDGLKELIEIVDERKKKQQEKAELRQKQAEDIKKAQAEGKKVEMVYDKDTKSVKPVFYDEKSNA